jgi:hypothetical protein
MICKTIKKLSNELQPYFEVDRILWEINEVPGDNRRLQEHALSYAKFQFGNRIPQKAYRERANGEYINNYEVEIEHMIRIYRDLINCIMVDKSLSLLQMHDMGLPYNHSVLDILRPWSAYITDLEGTVQREGLDLDSSNVDHILLEYSETEQDMAKIYTHRNQFDIAEGCCQRALSYARQYKGNPLSTQKTSIMYSALQTYSSLGVFQANSPLAVQYAEEGIYRCTCIHIHINIYMNMLTYLCTYVYMYIYI